MTYHDDPKTVAKLYMEYRSIRRVAKLIGRSHQYVFASLAKSGVVTGAPGRPKTYDVVYDSGNGIKVLTGVRLLREDGLTYTFIGPDEAPVQFAKRCLMEKKDHHVVGGHKKRKQKTTRTPPARGYETEEEQETQ